MDKVLISINKFADYLLAGLLAEFAAALVAGAALAGLTAFAAVFAAVEAAFEAVLAAVEAAFAAVLAAVDAVLAAVLATVLAAFAALLVTVLAASPQAMPRALRPNAIESTITFFIFINDS